MILPNQLWECFTRGKSFILDRMPHEELGKAIFIILGPTALARHKTDMGVEYFSKIYQFPHTGIYKLSFN
jgi:peptide methionine sulfoxide reductase MsrA